MVAGRAAPPRGESASLQAVIALLTRDGARPAGALVRKSGRANGWPGLITDGDLRRALEQHPATGPGAELQAPHLMTADRITVTADLLAVYRPESAWAQTAPTIGCVAGCRAGGNGWCGLLRLL